MYNKIFNYKFYELLHMHFGKIVTMVITLDVDDLVTL